MGATNHPQMEVVYEWEFPQKTYINLRYKNICSPGFIAIIRFSI
jgi:hypothetical protein